MKETNSGNKKFLWGLLLTIVTVLLCYMFVVLYFFYISPNNIPLKLTFWPFLSDKSMSEMYLDATVEIKFDPNEFDHSPQSVIGVNVREDGIVLAPYHKFKNLQDGEIKIYCNSGKVFDGELIFAEENFDLAVLKSKNPDGENKQIKMPFVDVASYSPKANSAVFSIYQLFPDENFSGEHQVFNGKIMGHSADFALETKVEDFFAVDHVIENGLLMEIEEPQGFKDGAVFDSYGKLLGFSYEEAVDNNGDYIISSAKYANLFLKDVLGAYSKNQTFENKLSKSFTGLDSKECTSHYHLSEAENGGMAKHFFFKNQWKAFDDFDGLTEFYNATSQRGFFLLEDFVYGEDKISAESIVTEIVAGDISLEIEDRDELFDFIYSIKEGQEIQIIYNSKNASAAEQIEFVV